MRVIDIDYRRSRRAGKANFETIGAALVAAQVTAPTTGFRKKGPPQGPPLRHELSYAHGSAKLGSNATGPDEFESKLCGGTTTAIRGPGPDSLFLAARGLTGAL